MRSKVRRLVVITATLLLGVAGCGETADEVVAYTSVDQVFSEPVFRAFEEESGRRVRSVFDTEETKSTGVLNRIIAEAGAPQADVFWSGDPARAFVLIGLGLVEPYFSPNAERIPSQFRAGNGTWTGFAARARVLLVNTSLVGEADRPQSIRDLADPRWRGRTAIANPLFGTTTMHAAALFAAWGEDDAKAFFNALEANDVRIASSNGEVKRLVASGEVAFGLTDTDDAYGAIQEGAPVGIVYPDRDGLGTLVMPTVVVLLAGAPHPETARRLIDHLLLASTEEKLLELGAHIPLGATSASSSVLPGAEQLRPMAVDYTLVAREMGRIQPWLREWVGVR
ncbi:MAG: extracellular solute-binding protein [Gemmatimonadetes bacterium]|nr:extracellular solute-binding protein [Gemmatimonadota bacterium]